MQHKLSKGNLLNEQGHLIEAGYATSLIKTYDRSMIKANKLRIKEWDYYYIQTDQFGIALTVADNGYMGLLSVSYIDYLTNSYRTKSKVLIMPLGKLKLPNTSEKGTVAVKRKGIEFYYDSDVESRNLRVKFDKFHNDLPLELYATLSNEPDDSMVIATPFEEKKTAFYYNQKILGMEATGELIFNNKVLTIKKGLALLDWGRGVWTYDNTWYWAAIQGKKGKQLITLNLGYGFGDLSSATENMVFIDGKAHKLDKITFDIPKDSDGQNDYLTPWKITSNDNRLNLLFKPSIDRHDNISLGVLKSDQHQVFGLFSGTLVLDDKKEVEIEGFKGFAEVIKNKW